MDEIALLKSFRLEDAADSDAREHARAVLRAAIARKQRRRRRRLIVLAFVFAAVVVGAAYGVVRELIVGDPAPAEVRAQPARFGHSAELIPVPHPDEPQLDKARVAAVLDSSVGTVYLFSSFNTRGPCASTWIEGDRGYQGRLNMSGGCGDRHQTFYVFATTPYKGKTVRLFFGHAGEGVSRIALRFGTKTVAVPLVNRWFLAEFPVPPDEFLSYNKSGQILERRPYVQLIPGNNQAARRPHQVTRARQVSQIQARNNTETVTLFVARASNGGYCQIVRSTKTPSNFGCGMTRPGPDQIGVDAMNYGGAPGGILLLVGPVGSKIATLQLRYQDGRVTQVPLHDAWALYEIATRDYKDGHRPETLTGHDRSGKRIAIKRLPWARR